MVKAAKGTMVFLPEVYPYFKLIQTLTATIFSLEAESSKKASRSTVSISKHAGHSSVK